jgi:hypothetical protein
LTFLDKTQEFPEWIANNACRDDKNMKHTSVALTALCSALCLICAPRAEAGHGLRIDQGNGFGCMSTYTANADSTAAFVPGGSYENSVACTPDSSNPSDLFPNGTSVNDAGTFNALFTATGGEMFQYYTGAIQAVPNAQVAVWDLSTGPFGSQETELELNGWCPGGSGASLKFGGNTYTGGCGGSSTDLLFSQSGSLVGYVTDASNGTATIHAGTSVPGWTESGVVSAPEMDPSSAIAGLTLLLGGLAVLRGGRRAHGPAIG